MTHACPSCQSPDVAVGACVLECLACGWHHLGAHPCRVCGGPARGAMGGGGVTLYGCRDHGFTAGEVEDFFRGIGAVVCHVRGAT